MEKLVISPTGDKYRVEKDFIYKDVLVPKGYITNGANIPRVFWCFIPPFKPRYLKAVVLHDWLCDKEEYKKADELFEEVLFKLEISFKTKVMVWAVKAYHKIYNKY